MADPNATSPQGTAEVTSDSSIKDAVEDISNLLGDPETDLDNEDQEKDAAESDEDEAEDVEDDPDDTEDPDSDGQSELKGGRFAPDSAKVKMPDGRVITVKELRDFSDTRVREFQRGFTEKTQRLSARESEVDQYAQSLSQSRDYLAWFAEQYMPKDPGPWRGNGLADPAAFLKWQEDKAAFDALNTAYQTFHQQREYDAHQQRAKAEHEGQQRLQTEAQKLEEAFPVLKNPDKRRGFWERLERDASKYFGITADEVRSVGDHRMVKALHAAVERERLREKAPQVREEVRKPIAPGAKRQDGRGAEARSRQVRSERLRSTGSFNDGVASLMDLDL